MTITTKTLTIICDQGTFTETVKVDNDSYISVYRNGYSNWDGKRHIKGFRITHPLVRDPVFDEVRKGAANEMAYRLVRELVPGRVRATNLTFTLRK